MPVVTVSGNIGTEVGEIARRLANDLEVDYVDRRLLVEAAQRLGVPVERIAEMDERAMTLSDRLSQILRTFFERSATAGAVDPMSGASGLEVMLARGYEEETEGGEVVEVNDRTYMEALTSIVNRLAEGGNVLFLGRGAPVILSDFPGALHVNIIAPKEWRIANLARTDGLTPEEATRRVEAHDRGREVYHRRLFKVHPNDPRLYHFTVNIARVSEKSLRNIVRAALVLGPSSHN